MAHVVGAIASMYSRRNGLSNVVNQIQPQVEELHVYLNDYPLDYHADWMHFTNVHIHHAVNYWGDLADNGKFILNPQRYPQSHFATFDDDLWYKPDYIDTMVAYADEYNAVVSQHGSLLHTVVSNYYRDRTTYSHRITLATPQAVDIIGTGVAVWRASLFSYVPEEFIHGEKKMSDLLFSALAMNAGVKRIVVPHTANYVGIQHGESSKDSIALELYTHAPKLVKFIGEQCWWR